MPKAAGLVLLIAGTILLISGYNVSQSIGSHLSRAITGAPSDKVIYFYSVGAFCAAVGVFAIFKSK